MLRNAAFLKTSLSVSTRNHVSEKNVSIFICVIYLSDAIQFLRAKAATALAHLSHRDSDVCLSVRSSVTRVDQSKTVQARIIKSLPSAAWKALVSGIVKLFYKFVGAHPERGRKIREG